MDELQLAEVEAAAVEMARNAGRLLLARFGKPLEVEYKSERARDPVTSADKASDEYLKREIAARFPGHGILSEEGREAGDSASEVVWVLDPLDGTTNYLNGMPVFGVSVAVVEQGRPVVGAMFVPSIACTEGSVYHARLGGGARQDGKPISVAQLSGPSTGRLSGLPGYFWRGFGVGRGLGRSLGDIRSIGSVVYEMALVAQGVLQYSLLARPHSWDVAAGVLLVREAGGVALTRPQGRRPWTEMDCFLKVGAQGAGWVAGLRQWQAPLIVGGRETSWIVARGVRRRRRLLWRLFRLIRSARMGQRPERVEGRR